MADTPTYEDALARLRDVLAIHSAFPGALLDTAELGEGTRVAARAALGRGVPFAALCADLGRAASEGLPRDPLAAVGIGRVMTRWAAHVYGARVALPRAG